ncbi:sulfatase [Rubellicoccus peritrichatus]|uniref:Sulfatase n=1 Tax=Rubellicoccus peritrichatus TaxID=3080537 RepID=A0AAQ3L973_9BACT|nr:sulfatase [Puniceicoccus sp. CR14]WOO39610.1 sulfatase [Puniceicoccus sp. CR14]
MKRPNILFIMCDDHAAAAISAYGSKVNQTPNIDRLANEGMRLDHCYVTNSICTPSRAAIITGTHNHINRVTTLSASIDNRLPNVAKHLRLGGYQTAIYGKWHLGESERSLPTGFDDWSILPGQGEYCDPDFINPEGSETVEGYVTDIITDKCLKWIDKRDSERPFFLMCHHKAPHRNWEPKAEHRSLYNDEIPFPETFDDDYANRASFIAELEMKVKEDLTYGDLDLVEPTESISGRYYGDKIPYPSDSELPNFSLECKLTGEAFTFSTQEELGRFKYQRYMRKYLQTVHSIDENVGRMLDHLESEGILDDTVVIYTSDQGFYLGEHGWFDKRLIYEQSFQMPFLVRYPREIQAGSVNKDMISNVDFAPTWLDYADCTVPNYMQGRSFRSNLSGATPNDWTDIAYHRYWMNRDEAHNVAAHYGIRDKRYKIVYWYNESLDEPGACEGDKRKEWELFDLEKDPLELFNLYEDLDYSKVVDRMQRRLEQHMLQIGDIPQHEITAYQAM